MKIALISTLGFNPGDEIIRLGVDHILRQKFPGAELRIIHKHDPRTVFAGFTAGKDPHRLVAPMLYRIYANGPGKKQENRLETADLVVFAGTPFIWRAAVRLFRSTTANAEWNIAVWERLFSDLKDVPVINVAAGTSVTNREDVDAIVADPVVSGFLKKAAQRAAVMSVRDENSRYIFGRLGFDVPIIPCSSILSSKGAGVEAQEPEYVAINLMRAAVHSWRGQRGEPDKWRQTIDYVVPEIASRHKILFVSHSPDEDQTAAEWFPHHPRFFSKNPVELLKAYSKAKWGLCNRVHATAGVATFGRPAINVGGDSRINLIEQFGLPAFDHRQMDGPKLLDQINQLEENYEDMSRRLQGMIKQTEQRYMAALESVTALAQPMAAVR